jgi:uncharacterized protein
MTPQSRFEWLPVTTLPDGGELRLPLHMLEGAQPGPTLGLTGVIHGNEPQPSIAIIRHTLASIDPAELRGTILAIPICNPPGFAARSRHTPIDGMNLNTAFVDPDHGGHVEPVKSVSVQIAATITEQFLRRLTYLIDFHSGGDDHTANMIEFADEPVARRMARAFNMPILLKDEWKPGQLWGAARDLGVAAIVAELGGAGQLHEQWIARGVAGVRNVLRELEMLPGEVVRPPRQYVVDNTVGHEANLTIYRPREAGIIFPDPAITAQVAFDGQPIMDVPVLGRLINPYDLRERQRFEAPFARTLMLATTVTPSWNAPGDFAYIVADADAAEILD